MKAQRTLLRHIVSLLVLVIVILSMPLSVTATAAHDSMGPLIAAEVKGITAAEENGGRTELIAQAEEKIQEARAIDPVIYSEESYEAVTDAITKLRGLIDTEASVSDISEAVTGLDDAVKGLVLETEAKEQAIKDAKIAILRAEVAISIKPYMTVKIGIGKVYEAKEKLEKILKNPASTSKEINAGTKLLNEAIDNVEWKLIIRRIEVDQNTYEINSYADKNGKAHEYVMLIKAKDAKNVTVPATVTYEGKTYEVLEIRREAFCKKTKKVTVGANVDTIDKQAFKGSKVTTVVLKTKNLTKKSVTDSLRQSKVKTIKVKVGTKKSNEKYVTKYKKIFTKKNAGRKVTVK